MRLLRECVEVRDRRVRVEVDRVPDVDRLIALREPKGHKGYSCYKGYRVISRAISRVCVLRVIRAIIKGCY